MPEYAVGYHASKHSGRVDVQALKDQGFTWMYSRIGMAWGYVDPFYAINLANARAVNMPFGGYFVPSFPDGYLVSPDDHINNLENGLESADELPDFLVDDIQKFSGLNHSRKHVRETIYQLSLYMWDRMQRRDEAVLQYTRKNIWDPKVGDGVLAIDPGPSHNIASDYPLHVAHYQMAAGLDWRQYLQPGGEGPDIPQAWIPYYGTGPARGKYTGWKVQQITDKALGVEGTDSKNSAIELMKRAFFDELYPDQRPPPNGTGSGGSEPPPSNGDDEELIVLQGEFAGTVKLREIVS